MMTVEIDLQETRTASTHALLKLLSVVLIQIFPSDRACARIFPCHFFTQAGRIYASVIQLSGCDNLNEEEQVGIRRASHYKPKSHLDQSVALPIQSNYPTGISDVTEADSGLSTPGKRRNRKSRIAKKHMSGLATYQELTRSCPFARFDSEYVSRT